MGRGLIGTMATTAVVAGTATAVSRGCFSRVMDGKAQAQQQEQMAEQAALEN